MSALREAAQQALEALGLAKLNGKAGLHPAEIEEIADAINALKAALAQEQTEPLNLSDRAVQRRLAAQWGYVPAKQAEPAAWMGAYDKTELYYRKPSQADVVPLYTAPPRCPNCASLEAQNTELDRKLAEMEQTEPVAWMVYTENGTSAYVTDNPNDLVGAYRALALYTAPPRRTMVPLTAQQLDGVIERHVGGSEITDDVYASMEQFARAIEKASWEKNHG